MIRFLLKSVKNICIIQLKSVILQREKVLKSVDTHILFVLKSVIIHKLFV